MKKIGIVIRSFEENGKLFVGCRKDVFDAFTSDFVQIIFIPIEFSYQQVLDLVRLCDGIVLTGGDHFVRQDFWLINYLYQNDVQLWEYVWVCKQWHFVLEMHMK